MEVAKLCADALIVMDIATITCCHSLHEGWKLRSLDEPTNGGPSQVLRAPKPDLWLNPESQNIICTTAFHPLYLPPLFCNKSMATLIKSFILFYGFGRTTKSFHTSPCNSPLVTFSSKKSGVCPSPFSPYYPRIRICIETQFCARHSCSLLINTQFS